MDDLTALPPKIAATFANDAYRISRQKTEATSLARATEDADAGGAFKSFSPAEKEVHSVATKSALVASSGWSKQDYGFGLVYDYNAGRGTETVVAFRGTVFDRISDWVTNAHVAMVNGVVDFPVHEGFATVYKKMKGDLEKILEGRSNKAAPVHFVGHSLGGALATIAAANFARHGGAPAHLYTFGTPRLGGAAMEMEMRRRFKNGRIYCVYDLSDPVAQVPLWPFYPLSQGTIALASGSPLLSVEAHSMAGNYQRRLSGSAWPKSFITPHYTVDKLLDLAEANSGHMSGMGFYFLGMALRRILAVLHPPAFLANAAVSGSVFLLDLLSYYLVRGVSIIGETILRFVKIALRWVGAISKSAAVSASDLTQQFFRYLLERMAQPVFTAARAATNLIT